MTSDRESFEVEGARITGEDFAGYRNGENGWWMTTWKTGPFERVLAGTHIDIDPSPHVEVVLFQDCEGYLAKFVRATGDAAKRFAEDHGGTLRSQEASP